jgi:hypothetical protein
MSQLDRDVSERRRIVTASFTLLICVSSRSTSCAGPSGT